MITLRLCHPAGGGPSHGHRQHAQHGKDHACVSGDMLANRQTDTHRDMHTQTCSLQYFVSAPTGTVINNKITAK